MLKIRDFAKLAEVSMTTLRYYDEIGLLKPIHVDPATGFTRWISCRTCIAFWRSKNSDWD